MAWLHAVPEGQKKSRLASYKALDEESLALRMPPIEGAEYIIGLLQEAGLMSTSGMGALPLSWQEIDAWLRCTERNISIGDRLLIRELSEVYVGELNQASAKDRQSPWTYVQPKVDRPAVASKLLNALRSMKKRPTAN